MNNNIKKRKLLSVLDSPFRIASERRFPGPILKSMIELTGRVAETRHTHTHTGPDIPHSSHQSNLHTPNKHTVFTIVTALHVCSVLVVM